MSGKDGMIIFVLLGIIVGLSSFTYKILEQNGDKQERLAFQQMMEIKEKEKESEEVVEKEIEKKEVKEQVVAKKDNIITIKELKEQQPELLGETISSNNSSSRVVSNSMTLINLKTNEKIFWISKDEDLGLRRRPNGDYKVIKEENKVMDVLDKDDPQKVIQSIPINGKRTEKKIKIYEGKITTIEGEEA